MTTMWALLTWAGVLGCAGSDPMAADDVVQASVEENGEPGARVEGTWKVELKDKRARRFAIIGAALSAEPLRVQGLGSLDRDEKDLYETWARKQGPEVRKMSKKLRMTRARYIVSEGRITVQVDNDGIIESYGPVDFDTLGSSDRTTVLRFDPGMGNGYETHTLIWAGNDKATDRVTANGQSLIELPWVRVE